MSADLDKAIDRAVREMLAAEPRADLRARVVARIDARPASSFQLPVASWVRFGALVGAAAVLILFVTVARRSEPPARVPTIAGAREQRSVEPQRDRRWVNPPRPGRSRLRQERARAGLCRSCVCRVERHAGRGERIDR